MKPVDELAAAAATLRKATFSGAMTATPAVAALLAAREPLAEWLEHCRGSALALHKLTAAFDEPPVNTHALATARAINGGGRQ
ncbi:hypothetical protein [Streptomyces cylindrosporus]|uniref:Uncharacterized protein n=1 Tax=Streptomyces cylindrosporus TaxID=2927583 RepID=A0ABS9YK05_9ACTN|nr:hypothetical protein [Streptomyces cylindrosporus]MCI3277588.1 hypothetical protein [Streptomyces cylindrosporus]